MPNKSLLRLTYIISLMLLFHAATLYASEPPSVVVNYVDGAYTSNVSATINAKPDDIYRLLTSYDQLNAFSRLIKTSRLLPDQNLLLRLKVCFAFICFDKQQTLALTISKHSIAGHIIPEHSDFKSGWMKWQLSGNNNMSVIQFSSELTPDFWVPPIIGPLLIQYKLKREAQYSIQQLELLSTKQI